MVIQGLIPGDFVVYRNEYFGRVVPNPIDSDDYLITTFRYFDTVRDGYDVGWMRSESQTGAPEWDIMLAYQPLYTSSVNPDVFYRFINQTFPGSDKAYKLIYKRDDDTPDDNVISRGHILNVPTIKIL